VRLEGVSTFTKKKRKSSGGKDMRGKRQKGRPGVRELILSRVSGARDYLMGEKNYRGGKRGSYTCTIATMNNRGNLSLCAKANWPGGGVARAERT